MHKFAINKQNGGLLLLSKVLSRYATIGGLLKWTLKVKSVSQYWLVLLIYVVSINSPIFTVSKSIPVIRLIKLYKNSGQFFAIALKT